MATEQYMSPLYAAFLSAYDINDDTAPTTDPDMFKQYVVLRKTAQDYAKSFNVSVLRRETDMVKSALKAQEQSQSYHAKLEGIKSDDRQATVKALTDRANNIDDNYTRLAGQMSKFDSQLFLPARSAFDNADKDSAAAWETLFNTLNSKGGRAVGSDPESVGLATQMLKMTMNVSDLNAVTPDEVQAAVARDGSSELAARAAQFVREAQQKNTEVITTLKSLDGSRKELRDISAMGLISDTEIQRAQRISAEAEEVLKNSFGGTPEELSERLEDLRARDTEYQGLLNDARKAFDLAVQPGQEGLRTRMGRLLANEDFAAWAQDNGFKKLGRSKIDENGEVVYVQGLDDAQAIARYAYQLQHPDRHGPLFGRRGSTNQLVRITATDPEQRAQILEQNKLDDGRYAVDAEGALLPPLQYEQRRQAQGFAPQGYEYAGTSDKREYIKTPTGDVYLVSDNKYVKVEPPEGLKFRAAVVFDKDNNVERYMTAQDFAGGNVAVGYPNADEAVAIAKKDTTRVVSADQLQSVGEIQVVGYRDRLHSGKAAQYGSGAISINGGKHVFTRGVKIEVLDEDRPDLGAGAARLLPGEAGQKALAARAETQEAGLDYERLTAEELRDLPPVVRPPPPPPPEVIPTALDVEAARSGSRALRAASLDLTGVGSTRGVAAAADMLAQPTAASAVIRATDDAGFEFEIDDKAETVKVVGAPGGESLEGKKTVFSFAEAGRLGMMNKLKRVETPAPAPPAERPRGPVSVTSAPAPVAPSYTLGEFAGSRTVEYDSKRKPSVFERLATERAAKKAEAVRGAKPQVVDVTEDIGTAEPAPGTPTPTLRDRKKAAKRQTRMAAAVEGAEAGVPETRPVEVGSMMEARRAGMKPPGDSDEAGTVKAMLELEAYKRKEAAKKAAEEEKAKKQPSGDKPLGAYRAIRDAARPANLLNGTTTTRSA